MIRKLLDFRAYLIVIGIFIGICSVAISELFAGSCVMLEMPHIEGGVEVTIQNMINDMERERNKPIPPKPETDDCNVHKDLIKETRSWLA